MKIFFAYENSRGGGAIAMENIVSHFKKSSDMKIVVNTSLQMARWGMAYFFSWIITICAYWSRLISKQTRIDWVYTSTYIAAVSATMLKPIRKYKICFHYHGSEIPNNPYIFPNSRFFTQEIKRFIITQLHYFFLKSTDVVIVPSNFSEKLLIKNFGISTGKKIQVIYNGVDSTFFKRFSATYLKKLKKNLRIKNNDFTISYFGRLEEHKNVHILIHALKYLRKNIKSKLLVVYLKPNNSEERRYKKCLFELARNIGITNNIIWIENPLNLPLYYQLSDLVVLPSDSEQMPLVMLEAFASKTIFLGTPVGGITEVLNKIDKRLLIEHNSSQSIAKKITYLLNMKQSEKNVILEKEYKFVRNLSWRKVSQKIYQSLVET